MCLAQEASGKPECHGPDECASSKIFQSLQGLGDQAKNNSVFVRRPAALGLLENVPDPVRLVPKIIMDPTSSIGPPEIYALPCPPLPAGPRGTNPVSKEVRQHHDVDVVVGNLL